jgi:hypothetical protein
MPTGSRCSLGSSVPWACVSNFMNDGMVSRRGNSRDQSGLLREAAFGTRKLIGVDIGLDELAGTCRKRAVMCHHAPHQ